MDNIYNSNNLKELWYKDESLLKKRQALIQYDIPKISISQEIISLIDLNLDKYILDVGCGTGDLVTSLRKENNYKGKLFAVDISEGIMREGIEKNISGNLDINFEVSDAQNLPFNDSYFDVIIAKHMLYHVPNIEKAVNEVYRTLKKGGKFIVSLNSTNTKNKIKIIRNLVSNKFNLSWESCNDRLNIENFPLFKGYFKNIKLNSYETITNIKYPQLYVDYFDSTINSCNPIPTKETWKEILSLVNEIIKKEIKEKGVFTENNIFGIYLLKKD